MKQVQALRGFKDLYPQDKALQNFVFEKFREVAKLFGFEEYDGPIVEPVSLYADKSSQELLETQTFQIKPRDKDDQWILRPEMTPTLARMVAAKSNELIFPVKYFNIGPRFRYEAPQKGRSREFWQTDFDIVGSDSVLSDAEIVLAAITILKKLGFDENDFEVKINSRSYLQAKLLEAGVKKEDLSSTLQGIDKLDKSKVELPNQVKELIDGKLNPDQDPYFKELFSYLKEFGVSNLCSVDLKVVRGLDYYTGIVFEIKKKNASGRVTLLGGGRYANLVSSFNEKANISGVGFSVSEISLLAYLTELSKLPNVTGKTSTVFVTIFSQDTTNASIQIINELRNANISAELYTDPDKKLDKQLKYADRNSIPYVLILGPEEIQKNVFKLKDMKTKEQKELTQEQLLSFLAK